MGITPKIYLFSKTPSTSEGVIHHHILKTIYFNIPSNIYSYDFLLITSKEAINALLKDGVKIEKLLLICISKKSADYAIKRGFKVKEYSDGYAECLDKLLKEKYESKKVLYLRAKVVASDVLLYLDNFIVYETLCQSENYKLEGSEILIFTLT